MVYLPYRVMVLSITLRLFKALKADNYEGWLVVEAEQDPAIANPLEYATLGANNLQQLCADAGITLSA